MRHKKAIKDAVVSEGETWETSRWVATAATAANHGMPDASRWSEEGGLSVSAAGGHGVGNIAMTLASLHHDAFNVLCSVGIERVSVTIPKLTPLARSISGKI